MNNHHDHHHDHINDDDISYESDNHLSHLEEDNISLVSEECCDHDPKDNNNDKNANNIQTSEDHHEHSHSHDGGSATESNHVHECNHEHNSSNEHAHDHEHSHDHDGGSATESNHVHECNHEHNSSNEHTHDHEHSHGHDVASEEYNPEHSIGHYHDQIHEDGERCTGISTKSTDGLYPKPVYVAIIREQMVDVYDANGQLKSFKHPGGRNKNAKKDMNKICFSSHGNDVGSLLTPCFDDDGRHGEPEEGCFCGVDDPHIHAHYHEDKFCNEKNRKNDTDVMKLANLTLLLEDEDSTILQDSDLAASSKHLAYKKSNSMPLSESLPAHCNSQEYRKVLRGKGVHDDDSSNQKLFKVFHHDHYDLLVHNENTGNLHLEHDCNDCGDKDIHGKLDLVYQRSWQDEETDEETCGDKKGEVRMKGCKKPRRKSVKLSFYRIPKKTFRVLDAFIEDIFTTNTSDRVNVVLYPNSSPNRYAKPTSRCPLPSCVGNNIVRQNEESSLLQNDEMLMTTRTATSDKMTTVQSKIFVQQICCASEIPMINDVVKPLAGVSEVRVNTLTKIVYVTHETKQLGADAIVAALNKAKFGAKLKFDGAETLRALVEEMPLLVQSKVYVKHICCASEIPMINNIVLPLRGVKKTKVNTMTKIVYVTHDPQVLSAESVVDALNRANFGAKLELDGAVNTTRHTNPNETSISLESHKKSNVKFVESTFLVSSLFDDVVILELKKVISNHFSKDHVSHIEAHILSRTVKVDHNPYLVKVETIKNLLTDSGLDLSIHTDGFKEGIWAIKTDDDELENHKPKLQWHVALSGIFWVISLLYMIGGNWHYLEYLALVSVALGIPKIALKAIATLRRFQFDTNCMMLFATLGAIALQDYTEAAAVAFLFSLSEWLESLSTARARNALSSIAKLRPERARVKDEATNTFLIIPASSVPIGSIVSVPTGDKVPCDGVIVGGTSVMDESSLTGESRPIKKTIGDAVSGGTINSGKTQLIVKTTSLADDSAVARLIHLVEEAQTNRSPTEQLIDEFAKRYTPVVVLAALSMCSFPWIISPETGREWTQLGLITIVIACPCALIISTPITYVAGIAAAAQRGIVVKGGVHLEVSILRFNTFYFAKFHNCSIRFHFGYPTLGHCASQQNCF
jgi:cation transport ATPase